MNNNKEAKIENESRRKFLGTAGKVAVAAPAATFLLNANAQTAASGTQVDQAQLNSQQP